MSARREKRLRALERRVEALETIVSTPSFIITQGGGKTECVLDAEWSKGTSVNTQQDAKYQQVPRRTARQRIKGFFMGGNQE